MLKDAPKYFGIFSSVQGCSARSILGAIETQREPKELVFADSCSGFAVFKKARISKCFEAHVIFQFSENSKVQFWQTVAAVLLFV